MDETSMHKNITLYMMSKILEMSKITWVCAISDKVRRFSEVIQNFMK